MSEVWLVGHVDRSDLRALMAGQGCLTMENDLNVPVDHYDHESSPVLSPIRMHNASRGTYYLCVILSMNLSS
jgi:hypothetical protein